MDVGKEAIQTKVTHGVEIPVATQNACSRVPGSRGHNDHDVSVWELPLGTRD